MIQQISIAALLSGGIIFFVFALIERVISVEDPTETN
jgi:hypothetical protein